MDPLVEALLKALLQPVPVAFASERDAIRFVVEARWPNGTSPLCPGCEAPCTISGIRLNCPNHPCCRRRSTIFVGTRLASLRCPRVRALLLALRAMVLDKRGIAARPLAELLGIPHVTLWRHLHRIRRMLPPALRPARDSPSVDVCGRDGWTAPAHVLVDRVDGAFALRAGNNRPPPVYKPIRVVGENIRAWLNGTFHGVTSDYLPFYVAEASARLQRSPRDTLVHVLTRLGMIRAAAS